jgi:hypothetical protein
LKKFFVRLLISLTIVTALGQVTAAGQSKRPSIVAVLPDKSESAQALHLAGPGIDSSEGIALSPSQTKLHSTRVMTSVNTVSFLPVVTYDAGGALPSSVVVADLNGDGKPDVMVANSSSGTVGVLLGNGDGTFLPVVLYPSGGLTAASIVVADLNGDGKLDLAVATCASSGSNCSNGKVGVLLGNGDGTFQAAVTYATGQFATIAVAVADLNGDGKPDLIVANNYSVFGLGVLLGNGDGTFQPVVTTNFNGIATSIAAADVNGDGKIDVVMAACVISGKSCASRPSVLLGNGDGTFQRIANYGSGWYNANSIAVADVNGDGKPDLLVGDLCNSASKCSGGPVAVLLGNGDGTFQPPVSYSTPYETTAVAVADVNGDGKADLIATDFCISLTNCTSGTVNVLLGNGDGTFQTALSYNSGAQGAASVAVADLNADGEPDLIVANTCTSNTCAKGTVGVLLNNTVEIKSPTSTSLTSSLNPSIYGQKATWTATVITTGSVTPTGKVRFTWQYFTETFTIGSAALNSSGVATLTRSNLNADTYPLTAVYAGDAANLGSTSAVLNQVVLETTSTATLTSSPNPSTQGQAVTFTAKISSPTVIPTGPVTFTSGKTVLGTAQLSGGKAKLVISSLAVGSTKVTATYYGDSNIAKSSASVVQTVH